MGIVGSLKRYISACQMLPIQTDPPHNLHCLVLLAQFNGVAQVHTLFYILNDYFINNQFYIIGEYNLDFLWIHT